MSEADRIAAAVLAAARMNSIGDRPSIEEYISEYEAFVEQFKSRAEKKGDDARAASGMTWEPHG